VLIRKTALSTPYFISEDFHEIKLEINRKPEPRQNMKFFVSLNMCPTSLGPGWMQSDAQPWWRWLWKDDGDNDAQDRWSPVTAWGVCTCPWPQQCEHGTRSPVCRPRPAGSLSLKWGKNYTVQWTSMYRNSSMLTSLNWQPKPLNLSSHKISTNLFHSFFLEINHFLRLFQTNISKSMWFAFLHPKVILCVQTQRYIS
jgi:hypothetical protein